MILYLIQLTINDVIINLIGNVNLTT